MNLFDGSEYYLKDGTAIVPDYGEGWKLRSLTDSDSFTTTYSTLSNLESFIKQITNTINTTSSTSIIGFVYDGKHGVKSDDFDESAVDTEAIDKFLESMAE